uniref:CRAL-TRIO domain-containing protein n=1 Tax=Echinostoma caproni TaxID=27848 RepID=A0A183B932_9TREM
LVTNHLPHLTVGELIIQDELLLDPIWSAESDTIETELIHGHSNSSDSIDSVCSPEQLDAAFLAIHVHLDQSSPDRPRWFVLDSDANRSVRHLVSYVHALTAGHIDRLVPYGAVLGQRVPDLLLQSADSIFAVNQHVIRLMEYLWRRLHMIMPRRLDVLTINALARSPGSYSPTSNAFSGSLRLRKSLTNEDLYIDPVENVINSVDPKVFR